MKTSLPLAVGGLLSVGTGLSLFGDAVLRKGQADRQPRGPRTGWVWHGTLALTMINAGICLVVEAGKKS